MYDSPIMLFYEKVGSELAEEADKTILKEIHRVVPYVDKEKLIQALSYDRDQYQEGFGDGYLAGIHDTKCPHYNYETHFCDLVTQQIISGEDEMDKTILDSGERTTFETGAVRDMHEGKGRFDLLPMCVLMRLAKHYEKGAQKYNERNWEKGINASSFADSALRHMVKYMDGWNDEDHLIAAIWNLCGLAWTEEKHPELIDIPARKEIDNGEVFHKNSGW